jgi:hypothetical protein
MIVAFRNCNCNCLSFCVRFVNNALLADCCLLFTMCATTAIGVRVALLMQTIVRKNYCRAAQLSVVH